MAGILPQNAFHSLLNSKQRKQLKQLKQQVNKMSGFQDPIVALPDELDAAEAEGEYLRHVQDEIESFLGSYMGIFVVLCLLFAVYRIGRICVLRLRANPPSVMPPDPAKTPEQKKGE